MELSRDKYFDFRLITIYLVILAILIDSPTMYRYLTDSPLYGKGFGWPLGIVCLLYVIQTKQTRLNHSLIFRFPILLVLLLLYACLSGYNVNRFLIGYVGVFVFLFLFAYALYENGEMKVFLHAFTNVMLVISVISLIGWLFGSILNVLPGRTELSYDWANSIRQTFSYFRIYFENPIQNNGYSIVRNVGIFTEAPGYSGCLTYAMLTEVALWKENVKKLQRRLSYVKLIVFTLTMFTTSSTKGLIVVLMIFAYEYIMKDSDNKWKAALKLFAGVAVVIGVVYATNILVGLKLETGSGLTRMDDLKSQFATFLQHPLLGAGYDNVEAIIANQLRVRSNDGLSMGLTVLLAYGGLWMFAIYAGAIVTSFRMPYFRDHRKTWFLVVMGLVYNLFISNAAFSDPYIFLVAAAYAAPVESMDQIRGMVLNEAAKS